ncbi:hypothetical protein OCL06_07180 [Alteromonas sp. ASW11-19]|uniref:Uncharacterized protein n=1 Tax=Alteromonas salexigens TaxID=2982530 RepID=A0ABT2VM38_9ALTE|nr:hypothetical protein [Alteromonas salexigens]MCU7554377.1 hypothetical protein [Alteromonas salexigens]
MAEMFSNKGDEPNCIVMLAVVIKVIGIQRVGDKTAGEIGITPAGAQYKEIVSESRGKFRLFCMELDGIIDGVGSQEDQQGGAHPAAINL